MWCYVFSFIILNFHIATYKISKSCKQSFYTTFTINTNIDVITNTFILSTKNYNILYKRE